MAANDEPMPNANTYSTTPADQSLFGQEKDLTNENLHNKGDKQPMRSKTLHKIQKKQENQTQRIEEKLAKDEHDDAVAQVAQSNVHNATIQVSREAVKKNSIYKIST